MNTYRMELVIETYEITAQSEQDAEKKYAAYHELENCPMHENQKVFSCGCVAMFENVYHNTELWEEGKNAK